MENAPKVFCIGFQKTGTSSLGRALTQLGLRVCGAFGLKETVVDDEIRRTAFDLVPKFDAFQDNPWPILFSELDRRWPGSRFILTIRDEQQWLRSVVRHFGDQPRPMLRWIYGVDYPLGNEDLFLERYRRHNREVLEHFRGREGALLVMRLEDEDLWRPLCDFLSVPVPNRPFPHANKGGRFWKARRRFRNWRKRNLRRIGLSD